MEITDLMYRKAAIAADEVRHVLLGGQRMSYEEFMLMTGIMWAVTCSTNPKEAEAIKKRVDEVQAKIKDRLKVERETNPNYDA